MIARLVDGVPKRALILLGLLMAAMLVAPLLVDPYILSVLVIILYFA